MNYLEWKISKEYFKRLKLFEERIVVRISYINFLIQVVEMNKNNDLGIPVPDYVDENVSD